VRRGARYLESAVDSLDPAACPGYNWMVVIVQSVPVQAPPSRPPTRVDLRTARADLRRQIARLERELAEIFATAFPRRDFEWGVAAAGGPRVLGVGDLERVRDRLAERVATARAELAHRVDAEEQNRGLVERMIADPDDYRWVQVSNEDVGERGCKHWHSRPRWGIIGMFLGWWRVKLSSGCPLAIGRRTSAPAPTAP
jgi:hypothetical protein